MDFPEGEEVGLWLHEEQDEDEEYVEPHEFTQPDDGDDGGQQVEAHRAGNVSAHAPADASTSSAALQGAAQHAPQGQADDSEAFKKYTTVFTGNKAGIWRLPLPSFAPPRGSCNSS